ncbi:MAG: hypothetical protein ABI761_18435 [Saprospiraceae bacterium]
MSTKLLNKYLIAVIVVATWFISSSYSDKTEKVIQIDVSDVLNTRSVTTLTKGKLITWATGIDKENGYLTMAASKFMGDSDPHALPDNSLYPATKSHPEIRLHYSNDDGLGNQTRCLTDSSEFSFKIPKARYADLYLSLTSSYGASSIQIELKYQDGVDMKNFVLPDWFKDIPEDDPDFSYVAHNMGKWGKKNNLNEKDHHNIDALNVHPDPKRILTGIKLKKSQSGYLVFWAATGVKQV